MHLHPDDIARYLNQALNATRQIVTVQQLHGGAQKVVYNVSCYDGFTCILYVWDASANYVLGDDSKMELRSETLGASYGAELFEYNYRYLQPLGVRTPEVFYLDTTRSRYSFDFAIVEDVGNVDVLHYIQFNPESKQDVLEQLSATIQKMHGHKSDRYGQLNLVERIHNQPLSCEQVVLNQTLDDLEYLAQHATSIGENKNRLLQVLYTLYDAVRPRQDYGLIHGELGPDHVRVDRKGQPVLIDIEGARFFDIEYEHSFLDFRFGDYYAHLQNDKLDPSRLRFYKMHLHISYSSGPLQIIERGFTDAAGMRAIASFNVESTLRFLQS